MKKTIRQLLRYDDLAYFGPEGLGQGCPCSQFLTLHPRPRPITYFPQSPYSIKPYPATSVLPPRPRALGRHVHLELYQCPTELISTPEDSERFLLKAAEIMRATVIGSHFHAFNPYGVSGVVIIAESHLTVHTWPEHQYAAVDVFSCGDLDLDAGLEHLIAAFRAERHEVRYFDRGFVK